MKLGIGPLKTVLQGEFDENHLWFTFCRGKRRKMGWDPPGWDSESQPHFAGPRGPLSRYKGAGQRVVTFAGSFLQVRP